MGKPVPLVFRVQDDRVANIYKFIQNDSSIILQVYLTCCKPNKEIFSRLFLYNFVKALCHDECVSLFSSFFLSTKDLGTSLYVVS